MCQPTGFRLRTGNDPGNFLSLDNSLNDEMLSSTKQTIPQHSEHAEESQSTEVGDFDHDDTISLQPGQA